MEIGAETDVPFTLTTLVSDECSMPRLLAGVQTEVPFTPAPDVSADVEINETLTTNSVSQCSVINNVLLQCSVMIACNMYCISDNMLKQSRHETFDIIVHN